MMAQDNPFHEARRSIKMLADQARGLIALDDVLKEAATIQRAMLDRQEAIAKLEATEADLRNRVEGLRAEADSMVAKAKQSASDILADAARHREAAKAEADAMRAKVEAELASERAQLAKVKSDVALAGDEYVQAKEHLAAVRAEIERIKNRL